MRWTIAHVWVGGVYLAGCADDGPLGGSLTELLELRADEVRARYYPRSELAIEYLDAERFGAVSLRVTFPVARAAEGSLDLGDGGALTLGEELGLDLPDLAEGDLRLDRFDPASGATCRGTFDARLLPLDGLTLTAWGRFEAPLEVVDAP
jgi:hypothetical protein